MMRTKKTLLKRFFPFLLTLPLLLGVLAFGLFWVYQHKTQTKQEQAVSYLRPAPTFELEDSNGKKHALEDYRGSVIFLHFWASWCPPCLEEIVHWKELGLKFKDQPIKFISVSLDQNWEDALKILPSKDLPKSMISLLDPSTKVAELYGSYQYPETYLVRPDLKIITKWVGPQNWGDPKIRDLIDRVIGNYVHTR